MRARITHHPLLPNVRNLTGGRGRRAGGVRAGWSGGGGGLGYRIEAEGVRLGSALRISALGQRLESAPWSSALGHLGPAPRVSASGSALGRISAVGQRCESAPWVSASDQRLGAAPWGSAVGHASADREAAPWGSALGQRCGSAPWCRALGARPPRLPRGWPGSGLGLVWVWPVSGLGLVWVWSGSGLGMGWVWSGSGPLRAGSSRTRVWVGGCWWARQSPCVDGDAPSPRLPRGGVAAVAARAAGCGNRIVLLAMRGRCVCRAAVHITVCAWRGGRGNGANHLALLTMRGRRGCRAGAPRWRCAVAAGAAR